MVVDVAINFSAKGTRLFSQLAPSSAAPFALSTTSKIDTSFTAGSD